MVCPNVPRSFFRTALVAVLAFGAAAQTVDFAQRLREGQQLREGDHFAEARALYQSLLRDIRKETFDHRFEALVFDNLGMNEQVIGDYGAAETAFNHGLSAVQAVAPDDPVLISLKTHLAELYIAESRSEDGEPLLRQAASALRGSAAPDAIALSIVNEDLAVVCIMRRKFSAAEPLLREAQALIVSLGDPNDPRLTSGLLSYAGLLTAERRYAEAVAPAERAWQLLTETSLPVPKPYIASAKSVLAAVYFHVGRYKEALSAARECVDLAEGSMGSNNPRLGLYLASYAFILKSAGHKNDAKTIQKRADAILDRSPSSVTGGYTVNIASLR